MSKFIEKFRFKVTLLVVITLLLRIIPAIYTPLVADLRLYMMVGYPLLAGITPYELRTGAYSYPPLWMWAEAGGVWISEFFQIPFQIIIKIPLIISDCLIVLLIYVLAKKYGHKSAFLLGLFYALNPVSIIITGFHGQFDTLMILMILLSIYTLKWSKRWMSPLFLGIAIALKSFPVLLVPFFLLENNKSNYDKIKYLLFSLAPVTILLLPYLISDFEGVSKVLFSYTGFPDHGWVAAFRAFFLLNEKAIFARYASVNILLSVSKILFLVAYGSLLIFTWGRKKYVSLETLIASIFCLFYFLYGGVGSQYLLWVVPFLTLINIRFAILYTIFAFLALLGFYSTFYPEVLSWFFTIFHLPWGRNLVFYRLVTLLFWGYVGIILFLILLPKNTRQEKK